MKQSITITIESSLLMDARSRTTNMSKYVEGLIKLDSFSHHIDTVAVRTAQELLANESFISELATRIKGRTNNPW